VSECTPLLVIVLSRMLIGVLRGDFLLSAKDLAGVHELLEHSEVLWTPLPQGNSATARHGPLAVHNSLEVLRMLGQQAAVDGEDLLVITGTESTTLSRPIPWNLIMICTSWAVSFSSSDRLSPDDLLDAIVLHPLSQACDQLRSEVQHVHLAAATQSLRCGVFHISNFDLEAVNAVRQLVDREPCLNRRTQEKPGSVVIVLFFDHGARKSLQEAIPRLRDGLLDGIDGRKERLWKFYPSLSFEGKHSRKPDGEPFTISHRPRKRLEENLRAASKELTEGSSARWLLGVIAYYIEPEDSSIESQVRYSRYRREQEQGREHWIGQLRLEGWTLLPSVGADEEAEPESAGG